MKTESTLANLPSRIDISICAYLIWEREEYPKGRDVEHWLEAEAQLVARCIHEAGLRQAGVEPEVKADK